MGGQPFSHVWRRHRVAATAEPLSDAALADADEKGWTLFKVPSGNDSDFPDALVEALSS
jgi:hypothetical protein